MPYVAFNLHRLYQAINLHDRFIPDADDPSKAVSLGPVEYQVLQALARRRPSPEP